MSDWMLTVPVEGLAVPAVSYDDFGDYPVVLRFRTKVHSLIEIRMKPDTFKRLLQHQNEVASTMRDDSK